MAQSDSRRLPIVVPYLYPNLKNGIQPLDDYHLQNNSDGLGSFIVWKTDAVPEPTEQELADAKEAAVNSHWWEKVRLIRDLNLQQTDEYALVDRPNNEAWITHRQELRDLPTTITKPDFATVLNHQSEGKWSEDIRASIVNPDGGRF